MDFAFTQEQEQIREAIAKICARFPDEYWLKKDKEGGFPVELVPFESAGKTVEAGKAGLWDIAFVALDPARAAEIAQSPPSRRRATRSK